MILLLMALLGFSALCSADPVLMVRSHGQVHSRVAVALPVRIVAPQLTTVTAPTFAANTMEKASAPDVPDNWLCFQSQPDQCAVEAMGNRASTPVRPSISGD
jgi:hypothetical protein